MHTGVIVRQVGRCALGLESCDPLRQTLDANLFSSLAQSADNDVLPRAVGDTLVQLYSELQRGSDPLPAACAAFDRIRRDPEARRLAPVEVMIAAMEDRPNPAEFTYADAKRLLDMPWDVIHDRLPRELAATVEAFRVVIESILHEVDEGYVDRTTSHADARIMATNLACELRKSAILG
jgi:hypothetical protein